MKIQELAIIFIIIIIPMSFILSIYTQFQIETVNLQTLYDTKLTSATFDAIKAFQINTANSTTSDITNSKLRDIEASVSTFKRSLMSTFQINGYKEEDLNNFIPALVYTMYDGFYIYAPFENVNYLKDKNEENIYGLRPYIPYSCRYNNGVIDVVITYSLDNYITIQGTIDDEYVNDSGYLVDGIKINASEKVTYNGIEITTETGLKEFVGNNTEYPYIKINGTKYYYNDNGTMDQTDDEVFYLLNGQKTIQYKGYNAFNYYETTIKINNLAYQYYKEACDFTDRVRNKYKLGELEFRDAEIYIAKGDESTKPVKVFENDTRKIFGGDKNIEYKTSNFNQHRLEIIRNTIENNLSVAIANYNNYSGVPNVFQMPQLKEDEWDLVLNNISLISFVQGLNIGGKTYNGYTIVNNSESKELISEENIFIIGTDGNYHRIGDEYLKNENNIKPDIPAGRVNLDFKRKELIQNTPGAGQSVSYYYPRQELASYNSIITQNKVEKYDDIYVYIDGTKNDELKKAFYTALGRERKGQYRTSNVNDNGNVDTKTITLTYDTRGAENNDKFTSQVSNDGSFTINSETPRKTDNKFIGWTTDPTSNKSVYREGANIQIKKDTILYAIWEAKKSYTVTYDANGGNGAPSNQTKKQGVTLTLSNEKPKREGYTFLGWSADKESSRIDYNPGGKYDEDSNITLYAVWMSNTVTAKDLIKWSGWRAEGWIENGNASESVLWPSYEDSNGIVLHGRSRIYQTIEYKAGHKYWIYAGGKANGAGDLQFDYGLGSTSLNTSNKHINTVITADKTFEAIISAQYMDNDFRTFRLYYCNIVDLTETFGAGKEKDAEWCIRNLMGFDGEKTVNISD